jgi:hypothetical protein
MRHRALACVAAAALMGMSSFSMANFRQGDKEFTLGGSGGNDKEFRAGSINANASLGYFLTDSFEIGVRQSASYADAGQNQKQIWNGSTRGAIDYNLDFGRWRPFVGANIGFVYGQGVSDTWEAAPEAGLKYFVNDTTFLYGTVEYQFFFRDAGDADNAFNDGQFVYTLGIGFRF